MGIFSFLKSGSITTGIEEWQSTDKGILIDVRSEREFSSGHVPRSINVPLEKISTITIDKNKPLFVYCLSGARSEQATKYLKAKGYNATNIGGISGYRGEIKRGKA